MAIAKGCGMKPAAQCNHLRRNSWLDCEFLRTRVYTPTSGLNFGQVYRPAIGAKSGFTSEPVFIFSVPTYIFGGVEDWRIKLG